MKRLILAGFLLLPGQLAFADVVTSAASGFEIKVEVEVPTSASEAYDQFLKVDEWWDTNHSLYGKAAGFSIEPRAGGCFCETDGDKSRLHMLVTEVEPGRKLVMVGGLGPLQGLGLHGAMSFTFEPVTESRARIIHVYRVTGYHPDGLQGLATAVNRVQTGQLQRLQTKLTGAPP